MLSVRRLLSCVLLSAVLGLGSVVPRDAAAEETVPATVSDLVTALQGKYKGIESLEAEFVQVQSTAISGQTRAKGNVKVKKPRKARWETTGDQGSLFVTDGKRISVYTPSMNQVIQMSDLSQASSGNVDILALLEDISKLDEQFSVTLLGPDDPASKKNLVVDAVPRKPGGYTRVRLEFTRKGLDLSRVVFTDSMGGTTDLEFSNVRLGAKLDDASFVFTPPAGVTVIDGGAM